MKRRALITLAAVLIPVAPRAADDSLLEALRVNNTAAVARLVQSRTDANARDESGATALMYASIYGSMAEMRLLIDRGADVNAANTLGSTALMWAAYDSDRVALLLERGASVNARTRNNNTALLVATRYGNVAAMRLLIGRGANLKSDAIALTTEAHMQGSAEVEQVLADAGLPTRDPATLTKILSSVGAQAVIQMGFTERVLTRGAAVPDDNVGIRTFNAPLIGYAALAMGPSTVRLVLDRGANPNARGTRGITALMMAAAAPEPDPQIVRVLLDKGADVSARDEDGRTALDWALLQGETPVAQALRKAGAVVMAPPSPAPTPVAVPRTTRAAVEAALARLQPVGPRFVEGAKCVSCHHESLPAMAVVAAQAHGATIDASLAGHSDETTMRLWGPSREQLLLGRITGIPIGGFTGSAAYGLLSLAEERTPGNLLTDALALGLAAQQQPDGSWNVGDIRPPLFDASAIHYTALVIRSLDVYMPPGRRAEATARIARGQQFLVKAVPERTQDEAFKLLGLVWSKAPAADVQRQLERVLKLQRGDGGWGQRPTMDSDAYQTGQVLFALHESGLDVKSGPYQNGVRHLLRTQLADGTWFVQSRGFPFQVYFETGFPHGPSQFISAAATSWAALALAYAM
jgi:ankyrin repeat protein